MANYNRVILIGRLTRDPEVKTFGNGGKVAKIGFVVNDRKKNQASGQWEDSPIWLDMEAFNRGEHGKTADVIEKYCKKGDQIQIEGKLAMDEWNDKTSGQKRTKLKIVVDSVQLLDGKPQGDSGSSAPRDQTSRPAFAGGGGDSGDGADVPF
jgi:single-strand DNA-binding protein